MKINAKSLNKNTCTSEKVGKLVFIADGDVDAVQLAALAQAWVHSDKGRIQQFRAEVLARYCKKNNVTITVEAAIFSVGLAEPANMPDVSGANTKA